MDSQRVATEMDLSHRRSMSDPFENGVVEAANAANDDPAAKSASEVFFTTMPRFPVAEAKNTNCWSEPDINIFRVRGPTYLNDSKKIPSGPYLLRARGCDLFLTKDPPKNIGANSAVLGGTLRRLPTFIVNFRFPWGVLVLYFEIPSTYTRYLLPGEHNLDHLTPAEKTLAKFFMASEAERNGRLKLIPYVAEGPWIARSMVTGKPAIIGNKLPVTYCFCPQSDGQAEYLEADLDIGSSSATAKRIVSVCRRYMNVLTLDVGFVVQGNEAEELPEQMLGSIRVHGADPLKAKTLV